MGEKPMPPGRSIAFHKIRLRAPSATVAGSVTTQANAIEPTIDQRTCRNRLRPAPAPTTEDATTCAVETGAPANALPRMTAVDALWLAKASIGEKR